MISIHALLTESDFLGCSTSSSRWISIHALLTESDSWSALRCAATTGFQSTLSSRRATTLCSSLGVLYPISIHALLTESDVCHLPIPFVMGISIHALLTESDGVYLLHLPHGRLNISIHALLTESDFANALRATRGQARISIHALLTESDQHDGFRAPIRGISIHALLTESDLFLSQIMFSFWNFNPRSPHGERQQIPPNWPYRFCLKCQF